MPHLASLGLREYFFKKGREHLVMPNMQFDGMCKKPSVEACGVLLNCSLLITLHVTVHYGDKYFDA